MTDKIWNEMIAAAEGRPWGEKNIRLCGGGCAVSAAILSASGKIYTGVCIDTACTL